MQKYKEFNKRLLLLIGLFTISCLITSFVAIVILYNAGLEETKARLRETVESQASLMEAVARYDKAEALTQGWSRSESTKRTLAQFQDAHRNFLGMGETGEFTLAKRQGEMIIFLLNHRHQDLNQLKPVSWASENAAPMRAALLRESGIMVGPDYRGETVLAAFEPVRELDFGIVAKIDLSEVRAPYLHAGIIVLLITLLVVGFGSYLFLLLTEPLLIQLALRTRRLEETNNLLEKMEEIGNVGAWEVDLVNMIPQLSRGSKRIYGVEETPPIEEGLSFYTPESRPLVKEAFKRLIRDHQAYDLEVGFVSKRGKSLELQIIGEPVREGGRMIKAVGVIKDITEHKAIERELKLANDTKDRFFSIISHDLRGPFSGVVSLIDLLTKELSDFSEEQMGQYLKKTQQKRPQHL